MRCRRVVASRNCASELVVRQLGTPLAQPSNETCRCPVHQTATPLVLGRSWLWTSGAAGVQVLLPSQQDLSVRSREEPQSGSQMMMVAVLPKLAPAPRCPSGSSSQGPQARTD